MTFILEVSFASIKVVIRPGKSLHVDDVLFANTEGNSTERFGFNDCITMFIPDVNS